MGSKKVAVSGMPIIPALLVVAALLTSCADDDAAAPRNEKSVEDTVRASFDAENAKNVDAFLALWTDKGLESYDVGSRQDVKSGKSEIGADRVEIIRFSETKITGKTASTITDVAMSESQIAKPIFRVKYSLADKDGKWLIDDFQFAGSPPPAQSSRVVDVRAQEYAFLLDAAEAPRDVAFNFTNVGKEHHELTLFRGPDGVNVATAKTALENLDGSELENVPAGYKVDHIGFAAPGESVNITFSEPLASGTYILACYIPEGGFNAQEEPVNPQGKPHIQVGMINVLRIS